MSPQSVKDGGPAFPQTRESWYREGITLPAPSGMSLRDWLAGQALVGLMHTVAHAELDADFPREKIADFCYTMAEAMLAAREQG